MKKSSKTLLEFSKPSLANYDRLREVMRGSDKATPTNLELFMFAMAFGFKSGNRVEEIVKSGTGPRVEYLSQDNEALMAAVQLATTNDTDTLMDLDKRYTIAEQYAEGGIRLLSVELDRPGDFNQSMASELSIVAKLLKENESTIDG